MPVKLQTVTEERGRDQENPAGNARYYQDGLRTARARVAGSVLGDVIVESPRMRDVFRLVEKAARTEATVLITGESGSGKEVVAKALHHFSLRCEKSWVDVNCGAFPDHLVESELFGYEKGAFSGADTQKPGLFEMAHMGTLFLDEVGELDAKMQVKLLRVLDGAPYYRLGGTRKVSVNVRILAATNKSLESAATSGAFRGDLYHRLNQVNIEVPPLRERREDIGPLAYHFLREVDPRLDLTEDALAALEDHDWPGNVRELRNAMTRAAVLTESWEISAADLPMKPRTPDVSGNPALKRRLGNVEHETIMEALAKSGGRQDLAARLLGISRRTLLRRLRVYKESLDSPMECLTA